MKSKEYTTFNTTLDSESAHVAIHKFCIFSTISSLVSAFDAQFRSAQRYA